MTTNIKTQVNALHGKGVSGYREGDRFRTVKVPVNMVNPDTGKHVTFQRFYLDTQTQLFRRLKDAQRTGRLFGPAEVLYQYMRKMDFADAVAMVEGLEELTLKVERRGPEQNFEDVMAAFSCEQAASGRVVVQQPLN